MKKKNKIYSLNKAKKALATYQNVWQTANKKMLDYDRTKVLRPTDNQTAFRVSGEDKSTVWQTALRVSGEDKSTVWQTESKVSGGDKSTVWQTNKNSPKRINLQWLAIFAIGLMFAAKPSDAATLVKLNSAVKTGSVQTIAQELHLSTATGARDTVTLSRSLGINLTSLGTEGSAATFNTGINDRYLITWQFYTQERDGDDAFYIWDGTRTNLIATSSKATVKVSSQYYQSPWITTQFTSKGKFALLALDTRDRTGTSVVKVREIKAVPEGGIVLGILMSSVMLWRKRSQ